MIAALQCPASRPMYPLSTFLPVSIQLIGQQRSTASFHLLRAALSPDALAQC